MQPDAVAMSQAYPFLAGGGETGELIRSIDWSKTSLGSPSVWPQSLKTCVRIMLTSRQPIWIGWGKELIKLYNDPYKAIVGGKHPWAFGQPASVVWKDIWKDIEPMLKQVMEKDEGTYVESQLLIMERNGYSEETYYTFSYTPIPDDNGGTAGMICANTDDTERIISDRQLRTLTQLGKKLANVQSNKEIFDNTIASVKENPQDFPFAILYQLNENTARFISATEMGEAIKHFPQQIDLNKEDEISRLFSKAALERKQQVLQTPQVTFGNLPKGAWEAQSDKAIILPIFQSSQKEPYGFLVIGLNPYRLLDEKYSSFFNLLADQIATSFTAVHTIAEERKRTEALAEIDKAKTVFFSNISHEFRTPLALMLSPLQEVKRKEKELPDEVRENIDISYRNTLRLQKLVNTLLDFSRIEAGRMQAHYEQTDIATLTKDLASSFRSAIEKAGIQFIVECKIVEDPVYIDVDMWEKIIMNLLSNALKYTEEGQIKLLLQQNKNSIMVAVSDTGIGIAKEEQSKIFDRFHRVQNRHGRSQEGSGIGLAMVQELIKLHNGSIHVESEPGKGSTFIVAIPTGKDHLANEKIISSQPSTFKLSHAEIYIEEALKWLPDQALRNKKALYNEKLGTQSLKKKFKVLLADDNADMREYVTRLLSTNYDVTAVANGRMALEKINEQIPDLIISDVMMPDVDGFELVKQIKSNTTTSQTPIILLSARAGEEATLEGLQAGVDDYLIKPFSAKELLSRIESVIKLYQTRKETE
ncbi:MAG: ATP-binding response regulator, partial [Flavisolibacter sp.]